MTTAIFSDTDNNNTTVWEGYNLRMVIGTANLIADTADNQIRATLKFAVQTTGGAVDEIWIGGQGSGNVYNFDGTQVQLLFSGNVSQTLGAGVQTFVTDWVTYTAYTASKPLVVGAHFSGSGVSLRSSSLINQDVQYLLGASQAGVSSPTGTWTDKGSFTHLVFLVEMQSSASLISGGAPRMMGWF